EITREAALRGPDNYFELFEFSAKFDIIPTILTQDHTSTIREFLGQDTGFKRDKIKDNVIILADVPGTDEVKYIYGTYGKGFFSFLGGHDPEDYQHFVGEPPTDLSKFPNSPGYRLILNNVLLPSTKRKPLKT
ncbi:MAG: asparagine synthetase B, partial [candidate division WOR-3 bacterium]